MQQALTHQTQDFLALTVAKSITPLIAVIGKMVSLKIILIEEEKTIKAILVEGTREEKQRRFVHIMVLITTLLTSVTRSMVIHLDIGSIILKAQTSIMSML